MSYTTPPPDRAIQALSSRLNLRLRGLPSFEQEQPSKWWEDALYLLGKPEEYLTKSIGQVFTDDPAYEYSAGTNWQDQANFTTLFRKGGMGTASSTGLGLAASVLLDPLNLVGVGALTKAGKLGLAAKAAKAADILDTTSDGFKLISKSRLAAKGAELEKSGTKAAKKSLKTLKRLGSHVDTLNDEFMSMQRAGASFSDLELADSVAKQIAGKQRTLLSVGRGNHILAPFAKGPMAGATDFGFKGDRASRVAEMPFVAGRKIRDTTSKFLNKTVGAHIPVTEASKRLRQVMTQFMHQGAGDAKRLEDEVLNQLNWFKQQGGTRDDFAELLKTIEAPDELVRTASNILGKSDLEDIAKGSSSASFGLAGTSDLTTKQKQLMSPSIVSEEESLWATEKAVSESYAKGSAVAPSVEDFQPIGVTATSQGHSIWNNKDYVVVQLRDKRSIAKGLLTQDFGIPGTTPWKIVDREEGRFLVGNWHGGSFSSEKGRWTTNHLSNLEKTAAMLARKGYYLGPLSPTDIMLGAAGEVQIVNPEAIRKVVGKKLKGTGKVKEAMRQSQASLSRFVADVGDLPFSSSNLLANHKSVMKVGKSSFRFSAEGLDSERLIPQEFIKYTGVDDLIGKGNNTAWLENLDEQTMRHLGILDEAEKLRQTGLGRPIQVAVDDAGNIEVKEGLVRLAAAKLAGFEDVPIEQVPYTGEIASQLEDARVVTGPSRNATEIADDLPKFLRSLPGNLDELTNQSIRFSGPQGPVRVGQSALDDLSKSGLLSSFELWYTRANAADHLGISAARASAVVSNQQQILSSGMARIRSTYEHPREATLLLADILDSTEDSTSFFELLRERTGVDLSYGGRSARDRSLLNIEFAKLKREADDLLNRLAGYGFFSTNSSTTNRIESASRNLGATAIHAPDDTALSFINHSLSHDEVRRYALEYLQSNAPDLGPNVRVSISGLDGQSSLRGIDAIGNVHPFGERILPSKTRFFIHDADRTRLAESGVALWNDPLLGKVLGDDLGNLVKNPGQTFFVSRSGALLLGKQDDVTRLLATVFGEGTPHSQELGAITKDTIYISNIFGSGFRSLDEKEMRPLVSRLKDIAKKFQAAGFENKFRVSLELPNQELMQHVVKKDLTLGDLAEGSFINIPNQLEGAPVFSVNSPDLVVRVADKFERIGSKRVRDLARWVVSKFDEITLKEIEAGLPATYRTNYYARVLSPKLQDKMEGLVSRFFAKRGMTNWYNKHWTQRRFTDLRTDEMNDLFRRMQDEFKTTGSDLSKFMREDSQFMREMAAEAPELEEFFITEPFRAVAARFQSGIRSINNKQAADFIGDPANGIVLARLSKTELGKVGKQAGVLSELDESRHLTNQYIESINAQLEDATPEMVEELTKRKAKLETQLTEQSKKFEELRKKQLLDEKWSGSDIRAIVSSGERSLVMPDHEVKRLLEAGVLQEEHVHGAGAWKRVNYEAIPDDGVFYLMDPEVAENLTTRFGLMAAEPNRFLKVYDTVLSVWKEWTLFPILKYHSRNFVSNVMLGALGDLGVSSYKSAGQIQKLVGRYSQNIINQDEFFRSLDDIAIEGPGGSIITGREAYDGWINHGGITGGLHINELGLNDIITRKSVALGFTPASEIVGRGFLRDNALLNLGRRGAEVQENWFRFAAFIDGYKKTGDLAEAGLNMKKLFYNYSDLNAFERFTLRRLIPFYSWMRHNTPRMLETMATKPLLHFRLQQAVRNIQQGTGGPARPEEMPDWLADRFRINVGKNEQGQLQILVGDGIIPMVDAYRAMSLNGAYDMVSEGVTPFLKVPFENILNKSAFTKKEIERAPGEPARSYTLSQLGFTRRATSEGSKGLMNILFNESLVKNMRVFSVTASALDNWVFGKGNVRNDDPTFAAQLYDLFLGRVYSVDPERAIRWDNMRREKEIRRAKAFIKEGEERGRPALIEFGTKRLNQLEMIKDG